MAKHGCLVEQFRLNCVTRRNKSAQICQAIYFTVQTCNLSLLYEHLCSQTNNNDDDGEKKYGLRNIIA